MENAHVSNTDIVRGLPVKRKMTSLLAEVGNNSEINTALQMCLYM